MMLRKPLHISIILVTTFVPLAVSAHMVSEIGSPTLLEGIRNAPPIADQNSQQMAIDMTKADCDILTSLEEDVREAFLITQILLQREGSLSYIVGPKCTFAGPAQQIAIVSDPALTIEGDRERMFYLEDAHMILVSYDKRDTIAYGMPYDGDSPIEFFLHNRNQAEKTVDIARIFSKSTSEITLPTITVPDTASRIMTFSSSTSSNAQSSTITSTTEERLNNNDTGNLPTTSLNEQNNREDGVEVGNASSSIGNILEQNTIPEIEPLGPEPAPAVHQSSSVPWVVLVIFTLITVVIVALYLRRKKLPKQPATEKFNN